MGASKKIVVYFSPFYVVTGFFRSLTSGVMKALLAGGMDVIYTPEFDEKITARYTGQYLPNRDGFFEVTRGKVTNALERGKAIKVIFPWLRFLPKSRYKMIVLLRDTEEIRQSLEGAEFANWTRSSINKYIGNRLQYIKSRKDFSPIYISHRNLIRRPEYEFGRIRSSGWPIDVNRAAEAIDTTQYRYQRPLLVDDVEHGMFDML